MYLMVIHAHSTKKLTKSQVLMLAVLLFDDVARFAALAIRLDRRLGLPCLL